MASVAINIGEALSHGEGYRQGYGEAYLCSVMPIGYSKEFAHLRAFKVEGMDKKGNPTFHTKFSNFTTHVMPPCRNPEDYHVLKVLDTKQRTMDTGAMISQDDSTIRYVYRDIPAPIVRNSLVLQWSSGIGVSDSGGGPGIGPINGPEPSEQELENLRGRQRVWAEFLTTRADENWATGKRGEIKNVQRKMAAWLGITKADDHPWIIEWSTGDNVKKCLACTEAIYSGATTCKHCRVALIPYALDLIAKYGYTLNAIIKEDPEVAKKVEVVLARAVVDPKANGSVEGPPSRSKEK